MDRLVEAVAHDPEIAGAQAAHAEVPLGLRHGRPRLRRAAKADPGFLHLDPQAVPVAARDRDQQIGRPLLDAGALHAVHLPRAFGAGAVELRTVRAADDVLVERVAEFRSHVAGPLQQRALRVVFGLRPLATPPHAAESTFSAGSGT